MFKTPEIIRNTVGSVVLASTVMSADVNTSMAQEIPVEPDSQTYLIVNSTVGDVFTDSGLTQATETTESIQPTQYEQMVQLLTNTEILAGEALAEINALTPTSIQELALNPDISGVNLPNKGLGGYWRIIDGQIQVWRFHSTYEISIADSLDELDRLTPEQIEKGWIVVRDAVDFDGIIFRLESHADSVRYNDISFPSTFLNSTGPEIFLKYINNNNQYNDYGFSLLYQDEYEIMVEENRRYMQNYTTRFDSGGNLVATVAMGSWFSGEASSQLVLNVYSEPFIGEEVYGEYRVAPEDNNNYLDQLAGIAAFMMPQNGIFGNEADLTDAIDARRVSGEEMSLIRTFVQEEVLPPDFPNFTPIVEHGS